MKKNYTQMIKSQYEASRGNSVELFKTIVAIGGEIGLDGALEILQGCVVAKRLAWLERARPGLEKSGDPLRDGYQAFYERYLGLELPRDGEVVESSPRRLVMRWWNPCPTLDACLALGLEPREICRKVYEAPVQAMLSGIDPRLRFRRNYDAIRPHTGYCEEIIEIAGRAVAAHANDLCERFFVLRSKTKKTLT
jgi:hypothetical protein